MAQASTSKGRIAVIFGQYGVLADPINLPHFRDRLDGLGFETILVEHTDTQKVRLFLIGYTGFTGITGASLGAGSAAVIAGYLKPERTIDFVGGFQVSDYDPSTHPIAHDPLDPRAPARAVDITSNVQYALAFRNPILAATGGLGHATYVLAPGNTTTKLEVIERNDVHPGDFGPAQDTMVQRIQEQSHA